MIPVGTARTIRALDDALITGLGVPGLVLMEVAGRGAAEAIDRRWPHASVAVLCGPGNNGGDGYVIARWLAMWGHPVAVWTAAAPATEDARFNHALFERTGLTALTLTDACEGADVVVDALLGTGQDSAPRKNLLEGVHALRRAAELGARVVAVDLPTGVCADTGQVLGTAEDVVAANLTVTFGSLKQGLLCEPGRSLAGEVVVVDIGLGLAPLHDPALAVPDAWVVEAADVDAWLPQVGPGAAKWDRGHVAVRAGRGAAVLAAHGAFRAGAGLVTLLAAREEWPGIKGLWPEVILAEPTALQPGRHDVVVMGPGLGLRAADEIRALWADFPGPVVADADALTVLAEAAPSPAPGLVRVLTPHSAEAARLLGTERQAVDADRFGAIAALRQFGVPLLKGPGTLVGATPPWVVTRGSARLATAGSGDVLAGMVGAMLARGLDAEHALATAAYLHGVAGESMPENGTCRDLLKQIPARAGV